MNLFNSLLVYLCPSDTAVPARRNPTTAEIEEASFRLMHLKNSINYHYGHMDPPGKQVALDCLEELWKETPDMILYHWVRVRREGKESKVYTPELQKTLISQWERWGDKEAVEKEFSFLISNGRWHALLPEEGQRLLAAEPIVEGLKMWLEEWRRSRS